MAVACNKQNFEKNKNWLIYLFFNLLNKIWWIHIHLKLNDHELTTLNFHLKLIDQELTEFDFSFTGVCRRAMASLLDILQGHQPEELSREPTSVIDPMFDILLELASESETVNNDQVWMMLSRFYLVQLFQNMIFVPIKYYRSVEDLEWKITVDF